MEIAKLSSGKAIIGTKEIVKGIKDGKISQVVIAKNCPDFLIKRIKNAGCSNIVVFEEDQKGLGTKLGKPFAVACVGY